MSSESSNGCADGNQPPRRPSGRNGRHHSDDTADEGTDSHAHEPVVGLLAFLVSRRIGRIVHVRHRLIEPLDGPGPSVVQRVTWHRTMEEATREKHADEGVTASVFADYRE